MLGTDSELAARFKALQIYLPHGLEVVLAVDGFKAASVNKCDWRR